MTRVIDAEHFLVEGDLPEDDSPVRHHTLTVARIIEYAGPMERRFSRETLMECRLRPRRQQCRGLLWVRKTEADYIEAFCPRCDSLQYVISNWRETMWADGTRTPAGRRLVERRLPDARSKTWTSTGTRSTSSPWH